ncbi:MAG TPA: hypothetical protein VF745_02325 [Steroidobacteraceae bacterium]
MSESRSSRGNSREPQPAGGSPGSKKAQREKERREKVQKQLDEALAATFPASDPVSIMTSHEEEDGGEP